MSSFKFRTLSLITAWSVLPVMILLKAIQVHRETVLKVKAPPGFEEMVGRRLDDPSFWAMVAVAIAISLILRAFELAARNRKTVQAAMKDYFIWAITATLCVSAYVFLMYSKSETFFFAFELNPKEPVLHEDSLMLTIQFVEGLINASVIIIGTAFLPIGLMLLHGAAPAKDAKPCSIPFEQKRIAALLATAGMIPITCAVVVALEQNVLRKAFKLAPNNEWFAPWTAWAGAFSMLSLMWPFLLLLTFTLLKCRRPACLCFRYKKFSELLDVKGGMVEFFADRIGFAGGIIYFYPGKCESENPEPGATQTGNHVETSPNSANQ